MLSFGVRRWSKGLSFPRHAGGIQSISHWKCFVAIERNTKLILAWRLGRRTARDTAAFTEKINEATQGKFQVTTDGFRAYVDAVHCSLGTRVDFAQLAKVYSTPRDGEQQYSRAEVVY